MSDPKPTETPIEPTAPVAGAPRPDKKRRTIAAVALAGAFGLGGVVTAGALQHRQPTLLVLPPAPIASMHEWTPVAVKGQVVEVFGSRFIVQDASGRALAEPGPRSGGTALVAKDETVTVQGRFDDGIIHVQTISHADGRNDIVGPPGPPHDGPRDRRGPDRDGPVAARDAPPPPPPPAEHP